MRVAKYADWSAAITPVAEAMMNGEVEWFTETPTEFDPRNSSKTGEPIETIIATTPARIQHLREPRNVANTYEWTAYRRIRCQIPASDLSLPIFKGVKGRITNGGKDPNLTGLVLLVQDARNSSWAAIRTVECIVESIDAPSGGGSSSA